MAPQDIILIGSLIYNMAKNPLMQVFFYDKLNSICNRSALPTGCREIYFSDIFAGKVEKNRKNGIITHGVEVFAHHAA
ncbi:MAG: hypothetical protein PHQ27_05005 [Victivallales bacterium]|nr:hypothetical protein [Victivallales bacterium]